MTTFQLLLFIIAGAIFYLFFKQLFSGNHPKRGVDFESKRDDAQIGGISRPDKTFSKPAIAPSRIEQLMAMADEAMGREDYDEAHKALSSLLIIDPEHLEALQKMGSLALMQERYSEAKESFEKLLHLDERDDMAHALLANALHKMQESSKAQIHHKKSIELDPDYAPHHFNYANTLYDLEHYNEALEAYRKSYALDSSLEVAKEMISKLEARA
jgi:tetratricopeptide (TPR) repeat protein